MPLGLGTNRQSADHDALQVAEQRYRLLFERNLAAVVRWAPDGSIIDCNEAFAHLVGRASPDELAGCDAWDLYFDEVDRKGLLKELRARGSLPTSEWRFRREDGSAVQVRGGLDLTTQAGAEVIQCAVLDGTERLRLEEARAELLRQEQAAQRAARAAQRWLSFLSEASKLLAASLDYRMTLVHVAQLAMPFLCDWCAVDVLEEEGTAHRLAPCHSGTLRLAWREKVRYAYPVTADSPHPLCVVLATGRSRIVEQVTEKALLEPDQRHVVQAKGDACAVIVPLMIRGRVQGAFLLVSSGSVPCSTHGTSSRRRFSPSDLPLAEDLGRRVAGAIDNARLLCEAQQRERELHALTARLAVAEDNERRRLALDLHDSIGQTLSVLKLNLESADAIEQSPHRPPQRLTAALHLLQEVIAQVRTMTFNLYPAMLDDLGLAPTLHWYAEQFKGQTGIQTEVSETGRRFSLSAGMAGSLFRVVKELLANIAKHAGAREAVVTLRWERDGLRLVVADDGCGFDPARLWAPPNATGLGLLGIRERVTALGGQVLIESEPGLGVRVILEVPRKDRSLPHQPGKPRSWP
jgi:PAS domain S-box-containing protein